MMVSQQYRLPSGGLVDRSRTIWFEFDGQDFTGHPGDTLASALLANGVRLTGRSFKYHRPRGILTAGSEEPNALVELRTGPRREANTKATMVELYNGLEASSQNRWPSLNFDVMAINSLLSPVIVAGFYYKTFMWPAALWEKLYEPAIRRAAGLGRASDDADPDTYEKANAFCDVLVIGGGPAGLAAALSAARSGARVILADENFALGGRCIDDNAPINDKCAVRMGGCGRSRALSNERRAHHAPYYGVRHLRRRHLWRRRARQRSSRNRAFRPTAPASLAYRRQASRTRLGRYGTPDRLRRQ